jgi:hypothetical protein
VLEAGLVGLESNWLIPNARTSSVRPTGFRRPSKDATSTILWFIHR